MSNSEQILKNIASSLKQHHKPTVKVEHPDYSLFKAKVDALKQLDPSLVTLFRLCDEIISYIDKQQKEPDMLKPIATAVEAMSTQLNSNLKKIDAVQNGLSERIKRFNLLEAKYSRMITHVNGVLEELERVLRQL